MIEAAQWHGSKEMAFFALLFPGLVANIGVITYRHRYASDIGMGICAVLPWGADEGGHLVFDELESIFGVKSGRLIILRSPLLTHSNTEVTDVWNPALQMEGKRNIVLFACASLMKYWSKEENRPITIKDFVHYPGMIPNS